MFVVKKITQQSRATPCWAPANHNPIYRGADILRRGGMPANDLGVALLSLTVMNSPYLENPLTMVILEDGGRAWAILNHVIPMVPPDRILQQQPSVDLIFHREQPCKRRCILASNNKQLVKVACQLDSLLGRGLAVMRNPYKARYGSSIEELRAEGPVSCILVINKTAECPLQHPLILSIRALSGQGNGALIPYRGNASHDRDLLEVDLATVRLILEFATPQRVDVPFAPDLLNKLATHNAINGLQLDEVILRFVRTLAILNNLKAPSNVDMQAKLLNVDVNKLAKRQFQSSDVSVNRLLTGGDSHSYSRQGPITATKVDYYIFWALANGLIDSGDNQLTHSQLRIFEALKNVNLQGVNESTFSNATGNTDALISISNSEMVWARRETILKEVNSDGQEEISMSTLMKELGHLMDADHIEKHRQDGKRGYYYHVVTMSVGKPLELPHPSEIMDPIYQGKPVEVVNPLTGAVEKV
jgi:hypothetical protein